MEHKILAHLGCDVAPFQGCLCSSQRLCERHQSLSIRVHVCPVCDLVMDRDENAANNILRLGLESLGFALKAPAFTPLLAQTSTGRRGEYSLARGGQWFKRSVAVVHLFLFLNTLSP